MRSWIRSSITPHLEWWRTTLWWIIHIYQVQWWIRVNPHLCAKVNIFLSLGFIFTLLYITLKWGLTLWSLPNYLTSLGISFLLCKIRTLKIITTQHCWIRLEIIKGNNACKPIVRIPCVFGTYFSLYLLLCYMEVVLLILSHSKFVISKFSIFV